MKSRRRRALIVPVPPRAGGPPGKAVPRRICFVQRTRTRTISAKRLNIGVKFSPSLPNHSHHTRAAFPNRISEIKAPHKPGNLDHTLEDLQFSPRSSKRSAVLSKNRKNNHSSFACSASGGAGPRVQRVGGQSKEALGWRIIKTWKDGRSERGRE